MQIDIQQLSMTYPSGKQALKGLDLALKSPSLIGLLGPNGAGKSTLMKLLVAALEPTGGAILVNGQPLRKNERMLKEQLGYLPQDFGLFDELTVRQFLDYMAALKGLRRSKAAIDKVIGMVGLQEKSKAKIRTLSGGQRQRTAAARAIITDPALVLADEPTGALDSRTGREVLGFLKKLNREGDTVVLITHDNSIAVKADRIIRLQDGKIIYDGDAHDPRAVVQPGEAGEEDEEQEVGA